MKDKLKFIVQYISSNIFWYLLLSTVISKYSMIVFADFPQIFESISSFLRNFLIFLSFYTVKMKLVSIFTEPRAASFCLVPCRNASLHEWFIHATGSINETAMYDCKCFVNVSMSSTLSLSVVSSTPWCKGTLPSLEPNLLMTVYLLDFLFLLLT